MLFKDAIRGDRKLCIESPLCVLDDLGSAIHRYGGVRLFFKIALELLNSRGRFTTSFINLIVPDA